MKRLLTESRKSRHLEGRFYDRLAPMYEFVFARFCCERIQSTVKALKIPPGAKILDVGVGTGVSLSAYPSHAEVVGIDLAPVMLAQAAEKVRDQGLFHVSLLQMDALELKFPDSEFDYVMAFHVASVVPDHARLMREMSRVCKPGGKVVIINHFRSERPWLAPLVNLLNPVTRPLGWRTNLRYHEVVERVPLRVERRQKTSPRSLFTIVTATRIEDG